MHDGNEKCCNEGRCFWADFRPWSLLGLIQINMNNNSISGSSPPFFFTEKQTLGNDVAKNYSSDTRNIWYFVFPTHNDPKYKGRTKSETVVLKLVFILDDLTWNGPFIHQ